MKKKLFSVAHGPIKDGKPDKVTIVVAESFAQVVEHASEELISVQLLPDIPVIL